jgi:hypothetical protein
MLKTPIVLTIFNRPDTTARVFAAVRQAQPQTLLVFADGARVERVGEAEKCAAARAIIDRVDWKCDLIKDYSDINLGCRRRVASAITRAFELVESAIILEDDCWPDPTFFPFCEELLEKYRDDRRVMSISGNNFQFGNRRTQDSYYFSRYSHIWGWATWRRAWQYYDDEIGLWPSVRAGNWLADILGNSRAVKYWQQIFDDTYSGKITTVWDFQWTFAVWMQSGLNILPNQNLVSNIGFGVDGTHTLSADSANDSKFANIIRQ